jgi:hypothetical protein
MRRRTGGLLHLRYVLRLPSMKYCYICLTPSLSYRLNRPISVADLDMFVSTRAPDSTQVISHCKTVTVDIIAASAPLAVLSE